MHKSNPYFPLFFSCSTVFLILSSLSLCYFFLLLSWIVLTYTFKLFLLSQYLDFPSQWLHVQMFYSSFSSSQISSSTSVSVSSFSSSQISLSNRNNKNARIFLHIASSLCSFLFLFFKRFCKNFHLNVLTDLMVVKASSLQQ